MSIKRLANGTVSYNNSATVAASKSSSAKGVSSDASSYLGMIQGMTAANNAWSAAQAQKQMDFQHQENQLGMQFNHDEALLNRQWQEYMSNTAHQREVKDLMAAGLNPVLSAGAGAPVTSGATASGYTSSGAMGDTDMSGSAALMSILGKMLDAETSIANQAMSAQTQLAVAEKYNAASRYTADLSSSTAKDVAMLNRGTSLASASIYAGATVDAASISAAASKAVANIYRDSNITAAQINATASQVSAVIHSAASKYSADISSLTSKEIASLQAEVNQALKDKDIDLQLQLQKNAQTHQWRINLFNTGVDVVNNYLSRGSGMLSSALPFLVG